MWCYSKYRCHKKRLGLRIFKLSTHKFQSLFDSMLTSLKCSGTDVSFWSYFARDHGKKLFLGFGKEGKYTLALDKDILLLNCYCREKNAKFTTYNIKTIQINRTFLSVQFFHKSIINIT